MYAKFRFVWESFETSLADTKTPVIKTTYHKETDVEMLILSATEKLLTKHFQPTVSKTSALFTYYEQKPRSSHFSRT